MVLQASETDGIAWALNWRIPCRSGNSPRKTYNHDLLIPINYQIALVHIIFLWEMKVPHVESSPHGKLLIVGFPCMWKKSANPLGTSHFPWDTWSPHLKSVLNGTTTHGRFQLPMLKKSLFKLLWFLRHINITWYVYPFFIDVFWFSWIEKLKTCLLQEWAHAA